MKNSTYKAALFLAIFLIFTQAIFAQTNKLTKPIADYAETIEKFVEQEGKPHLIFADVADYEGREKSLWKKFTSQDELEKSGESYAVAYLWKKNKKTVAANMTYSSSSGDWVLYENYIFRPDGSAAKLGRELRTFYGDIAVERVYFYDKSGRLLKKTEKFYELNTRKPTKPTDGFIDTDIKLHKNLRDFPFANLITKN